MKFNNKGRWKLAECSTQFFIPNIISFFFCTRCNTFFFFGMEECILVIFIFFRHDFAVVVLLLLADTSVKICGQFKEMDISYSFINRSKVNQNLYDKYYVNNIYPHLKQWLTCEIQWKSKAWFQRTWFIKME